MIKTFFIGMVIIHGLIHLMGFFKAFNLAEISQLTQSISKPIGVLWLVSAILFWSIIVFLFMKKDWWWIPAFSGIVLSQILIIMSWQDAKFGTIPNLIILIAVIIGFAFWNFNVEVNQQIKTILSDNILKEKIITETNRPRIKQGMREC